MECRQNDDRDERENEDEDDVYIGVVCSVHYVVCYAQLYDHDD